MNWGNIQDDWRTSIAVPDSAEIQSMVQIAQERSRNLHRLVKRRDFIETTVALLIAPLFGFGVWSAFGKGLWITAFASAFLAGWCLYVPWRLRKTRRLFPDPKTSDDMLGYLKAERRAAKGQYDQLRGILWWYLGPGAFGALLLYASIRGLGRSTLIYALVVLGLYGLIYLLNQRAAARKFDPTIEQIDRQIEELSN